MAVTEARDSLSASNQLHERAIDSLKSQLHEEMTTRKLADQRIDAMMGELEQVKTAKVRCVVSFSVRL